VREIGKRGLHEQYRPQNIDSIHFCEELRRNVLQRRILGYCGIVDDDIDLELTSSRVREVVLGSVDQVGGTSRMSHVGLDGEGIDVMCRLEVIGKVFCRLGRGVGGVIQNDRSTFVGENFGDGGANAWTVVQTNLYQSPTLFGGRRVLSTPLEPPVITASFPSSGRIIVAPFRFVDEARW